MNWKPICSITFLQFKESHIKQVQNCLQSIETDNKMESKNKIATEHCHFIVPCFLTQFCSTFYQGSLQTEAVISEMLVIIYQSAQHYITQDCSLTQLCCENLTLHIISHNGKGSIGSNALQFRKPHC